MCYFMPFMGLWIASQTGFDVIGAIRAGVVGYVPENTPVEDMAGAVRMAHRGVVQLDSDAAAQMSTS